MSHQKITLISAMDTNQIIGKDNNLPWHLPADLKFFKQQTLNKTLLMGRKTCESLPFVLPKRRNLVLSRNNDFARKGFEIINSLDALTNDEDIMVIGGAKIYQLMLPNATHLILTRINKEFEGDTFFPAVDWNDWKLTRKTNHPKNNLNPDFSYDFEFYARK